MSDLPATVVDRAEYLTRRARETRDEAAADRARTEREDMLAEHGYAARLREEENRAVLVCYPAEWLEEGTAALARIDDTDRAIERPLSGPTDADWEDVAARNDEIVETVRAEYGDVHAANARALAEYAGNHHATTIGRLTDEQLDHFREEYYPRNVWPAEEEAAVLPESITAVEETIATESDVPSR
jgi:hypothetical protein